MITLALFYKPMVLSADSQLWPLLPLCAAVAIVYKTVRTEDLKRLGLQILLLITYMIGGLVALGLGLWLLHTYWPFNP